MLFQGLWYKKKIGVEKNRYAEKKKLVLVLTQSNNSTKDSQKQIEHKLT